MKKVSYRTAQFRLVSPMQAWNCSDCGRPQVKFRRKGAEKVDGSPCHYLNLFVVGVVLRVCEACWLVRLAREGRKEGKTDG